MLEDTPTNRRLIHKYIEVWEHPDGRIEIRANGAALPYVRYDRLSHIYQGAVVEHKRLGYLLQVAQALQAQRDDRRAAHSLSRANHREGARKPKPSAGTKKQREFTPHDRTDAVTCGKRSGQLAQWRQESCASIDQRQRRESPKREFEAVFQHRLSPRT